jgi:hypothetical protein
MRLLPHSRGGSPENPHTLTQINGPENVSDVTLKSVQKTATRFYF